MIAPWKKSYDKPRQCIKEQRHHFADKVPSSQSYGFYISHAQRWELDHREIWALKNWCFGAVVLEKSLDNTLDSKKSNQSFLKETNPEFRWKDWCWSSNTWTPDEKSWFIGKHPDAGKDLWQEEKGKTKDEMTG